MVYWVTDNILEDWLQLPDILPEQVQAARMIKHVFTGNLNASIDSNPPFPGKERHYLRA
jgi:radial spoke head protein 4/6